MKKTPLSQSLSEMLQNNKAEIDPMPEVSFNLRAPDQLRDQFVRDRVMAHGQQKSDDADIIIQSNHSI